MEKKSFRIRTTPAGEDKYLTINLDQSFETLEILSLKITQDKIYRDFSSDYGVLVGRVVANGGYGVPNAKVSIFIPLSEEDTTNEKLVSIYPYTKITDKTVKGTRYNLINSTKFKAGTFPTKQAVLDDDTYLEVYEKYYKFTTKTNQSGDYMIFGIPIGQQTIHSDIDLSDIGELSFTADSMVANGINKKLFTQVNNDYKFNGGDNLDQLPQIISSTLSVDIKPLWGDKSTQQIGITRADFKINLLASPVAYMTFAVGYDTQHLRDGIYDASYGHVNASGGRRPGYVGRLLPNQLQVVNAFKYDSSDTELTLDTSNYKMVSSPDDINKGIYMFLLPCDLDKVITNEYGELVPSGNENGIGTKGKWRVEVLHNIPTGGGLTNFLLQKNSNPTPFIVKSGRMYSVKTQMFDAYTLRDNNKHNIPKGDDELPILAEGDWLNGLLYFGYGQFDHYGKSDYPAWLQYQQSYYNVTSFVIDITDYFDVLTNTAIGANYYPGLANFKFYTDSEITPTVIDKIKSYNSSYGDINSSYQPDTATGFQGRYVFLKGAQSDWDCFAALKNYIG